MMGVLIRKFGYKENDCRFFLYIRLSHTVTFHIYFREHGSSRRNIYVTWKVNSLRYTISNMNLGFLFFSLYKFVSVPLTLIVTSVFLSLSILFHYIF
jgi:hypothetical protein